MESFFDNKILKGNLPSLLLFFIVAFFIGINFHTSFTILPIYITQLGGSELHSGIQSTVFLLTAVVLRFYFGPLADRKGVKIPLLVSAFIFCTSPLLFLACQSVWSVILVRIYQAIGLASFFSSASAYVSEIAPAGKLGIYIGVYRLVITSTLLIGPFMAIWVINSLSMQIWLLISFLMGLSAFISMFFVKTSLVSKENEEPISLKCMCGILQEKRLRVIYMGFALISFSFGTLLTFVTVYIAKVAEISNEGIYFTYFALASIVANLSAGYLSDKYGRQVVVWPAIMLLGLGVGSLVFLPKSSYIVLISSVLAGIGYAGAISASIPWLVETINKNLRTSALAIQENIIDLGCAAGSLIYGILSGIIGWSFSYGVIGLIVLLSLIIITKKNSEEIFSIKGA